MKFTCLSNRKDSPQDKHNRTGSTNPLFLRLPCQRLLFLLSLGLSVLSNLQRQSLPQRSSLPSNTLALLPFLLRPLLLLLALFTNPLLLERLLLPAQLLLLL